MIITLYNAETFERIMTIPKIYSSGWTRKLYETGSFEISLPRSYAIDTDTIILHGSNAGIVKQVNINNACQTIMGYDMDGLTKSRYITAEITYTGKTAEYIVKDMAKTFFMTDDRAVEGFEIEADSGAGEVISSYTFPAGCLADKLADFCKEYEIGYEINFDENRILFRTIIPTENNSAEFSYRKNTAYGLEYEKSVYNAKNVYYYTTEQDGVKKVNTAGTAKGILRNEIYSDNTADTPQTLQEQYTETENITCESVRKLIYGSDYKIGDKVPVIYENDKIIKIVTEISISHEPGLYKETPTFGDKAVNPLAKLVNGR